MKKRRLAKTHNRALLASLLAVQGSAIASTTVPGTLINVDFNGGAGTRGHTPDPATFDGIFTTAATTASVALEDSDSAVPDQWNGLGFADPQSQPLNDSKGAPTGVSITWSGFTYTYHNYPNVDPVNFTNGPNADGFYANSGPLGVVTISGLNPLKTYTVVPLAAGDPVKFTLGDDSRSTPGWNADTNAANWFIYNDIAPSSAGVIVITASSTGGNFGMGGFQIAVAGSLGDQDGDGMPDVYEDAHGLLKNDPADAAKDPDHDGLSNLVEYRKGTDPQKDDTDGDGYKDNVETGTRAWGSLTDTGTDPLNADSDGDGLADGAENFSLATGTDPNNQDTDADGFSDGGETTALTNPRDPASNPRLKATGQLINVDFNGGTGTRGHTPDPAIFDGTFITLATGASVPIEDSDPAVPDQWNGFGFTDAQSQPLADSQGAATDVSIAWSGFTFTYHNWPNVDPVKFTNGPNADGFYATSGIQGVVTISGLNPAKTYSVAPLGAGDPVQFTVAGDSRSTPGWDLTNNTANWFIYKDILPSSTGTIVINASSTGGNFGMGGFQITVTGSLGDQDGDGIPDAYEDAHGLLKKDPTDAAKDPDRDGLSNLVEYRKGTDPQKDDTDGDGLKDNVETGTRAWGSLTDTGTDPLNTDSDGDGLADGAENFSLATGTDPNKDDTDGDGFSDGAETTALTNPRDPASSPRLKTTTQLINVDFNGGAGTRGHTPDPQTFDGVFTTLATGASVPIEDSDFTAADQWNGFGLTDAPSQPLNDSHGLPTDVSIAWSGFTFTYHNWPNVDPVKFTNGPNADGFYGPSTAQGTVTISGLDPAKTYDVAPLGAGDPVKFTIGGDSRSTLSWDGVNNPSNWTIYNGVAPDSTGNIIITAATTGANFGMAGFQITPVPVPDLPKFNLTAFSRNAATGAITLTWESSANRTYTIVWNTDLSSAWQTVSGQSALPGQAGSMTRTFSSPQAGASRLFFKVKAQ